MARSWISRGVAITLSAGLLGIGTVLVFQNSMSFKTLLSSLISESGAAVERGIAYGPHARHKLDIYRPESGEDSGPIAFFLYGGGWRGGDRATYGFVGSALAARGITTVIPDYRVYPEVKFPAFVEDAARAYAWTSERLAENGGEQRPIVVIGHSAGAHIGALLVLDRDYLNGRQPAVAEPAGFVGLAGPYAFDPTTWHSTKEIFAGAQSADDARPVAFARPDAPPALVMHGLDDSVVRLWNMQTLAKQLEGAGADVRQIELPDIGHIGVVLAVAWPFRWRAPVLSETLDFIDRVSDRATSQGVR